MKLPSKKIAILGAGNGGQTAAADLSLAGFEVNLYESPKFENNIKAIIEREGIKITGVARKGFAKLNKVTTNIEEAMEGVDVVMIIVPAFAHEIIFKECAPHLEDGQIVTINAGNHGALQLSSILKNMRINKDVIISETSTLIYVCRVIAPAEVRASGLKRVVPLAAIPAKDTKKCIKVLNEIYPQFVPATNVLETSLSSANMVLHPPIMLMNAGYIERSKGDFLFYIHGASPSVARICETIDVERIAVGKALGINLISVKDAMYKKYDAHGDSLYERIRDCKPYWDHSSASSPSSLEYRYLTEDVPYGLVPLASLGDLLGVPTPSVKTIIDFASLVNQTDYWGDGLTAEKLGLNGLTAKQINNLVDE